MQIAQAEEDCVNPVLFEFGDDLRRARDASDAWALLRKQLAPLGVRYARYGFTPCLVVDSLNPLEAEAQPALPEVLYFGGFEDEWEREIGGNYSEAEDFVVMHCAFSRDPLHFRELYRRMDAGEFFARRWQLHNVGREMGYQHGVAFPLRDGGALSRAGMSMVFEADVNDRDYGNYVDAHVTHLQLIAETFHANLRRPVLLTDAQVPTPRELECLRWTAAGLRVKEIARRTGTHPKTVEKQLASVRARLNAATNAQAVAAALILRLLEP